jgi:hypothetical protein
MIVACFVGSRINWQKGTKDPARNHHQSHNNQPHRPTLVTSSKNGFFMNLKPRKGKGKMKENGKFVMVTNFCNQQQTYLLQLKNKPKTPAKSNISKLTIVKTKRAWKSAYRA